MIAASPPGSHPDGNAEEAPGIEYWNGLPYRTGEKTPVRIGRTSARRHVTGIAAMNIANWLLRFGGIGTCTRSGGPGASTSSTTTSTRARSCTAR